ncbi:hypothetical protein Tco_0913625 [Tanacetum coccineum]
MMTKILCAFKGQAPPSSSMRTTILVRGEYSSYTATITPTEETPSHTRGRKLKRKLKKRSLMKRIADDTKDSPKKLVKASNIVHPDPNEPVRVPFEINGKLYHLTNKEIQAHYELEERNQKAVEEAKLLEMTKLELIKVVHKEATKAGVDPNIPASAKGSQEFLKIQDA